MTRVSDEIAANHPALPGHFPGNPIVPGVVLLTRVFNALAKVTGAPVSVVRSVKFMAPLAPGERFEIALDNAAAGQAVKFSVMRGDTVIASGAVELGQRAS